MKAAVCAALLFGGAYAATPCTPPADTLGADDGNPHCWDRKRRCDGPNAHPDGGVGYQPGCGLCEGIGGIVWGDDASDVTIPKCTPIAKAEDVSPPPTKPEWGEGNNGKFTIENDRFIMIGKKKDPFCFEFFPSNNSAGAQCYRRQTGKLVYDMSGPTKMIRYDLDIHIPWPSDKHSVFGNVTTMIVHHGPNMWIVNDLYKLVKQCVCTQPLSTSGTSGSHNQDPIYPVMYNWTNHLSYVGREEIDVEYGIGTMQMEHWTYGPHHAWTAVGDNKIVRMWQPYNGFEVFYPGSWKSGVADPAVFENMVPPPLCKKGGAKMRIGCTDDGFPTGPPHENTEAAAGVPATVEDLKRARAKVPRSSHKGKDFASMSEKLNRHLRVFQGAKECHLWTADELVQFQAGVMSLKTSEMDKVYQSTSDRRALRGDIDEHRARWLRHAATAKKHGGKWAEMHRDGHCHEAVMWLVHHVAEPVRQAIAEVMPVPMLPYGKHVCPSSDPDSEQLSLCDEYVHQVSCQDCHADATAPADDVVVV